MKPQINSKNVMLRKGDQKIHDGTSAPQSLKISWARKPVISTMKCFKSSNKTETTTQLTWRLQTWALLVLWRSLNSSKSCLPQRTGKTSSSTYSQQWMLWSSVWATTTQRLEKDMHAWGLLAKKQQTTMVHQLAWEERLLCSIKAWGQRTQ